MQPYLTPGRYRAMALGIDLEAKSDAELASLIATASAEVNRYCAAPREFSFRGGTITDEEHQWEPGNEHKLGSGRIWPYCKPLVSVQAMRVYVTRTQFITFDAERLFFNKRLGYVQAVAAPITTALFTSIPPWLLDPPIAYLDYTYGQTFSNTERLYDTGDQQTFRAQNQFWTSDDVSVFVDGNAVTSGYEVDRDEGTVTFADSLAKPQIVVADYTSSLPVEIPLATGIVVTDLLGFANINASGLTGLSGIRVEEIELRQSSKSGFGVYDMHPAAKPLLASHVFASWG